MSGGVGPVANLYSVTGTRFGPARCSLSIDFIQITSPPFDRLAEYHHVVYVVEVCRYPRSFLVNSWRDWPLSNSVAVLRFSAR